MPPRTKPLRATESVRERGKRRRFDRIRAAAREQILANGYEQATLRAIAKQARVGAGTILRYVNDKRDLLFIVYADDRKRLTEQALAELSERKKFINQLIDGFRHFYEYFGRYPEYSRAVLREASLYNSEVDYASGSGSIDRLMRSVAIARKRGEITTDEDDKVIARLVFDIAQTECRHWLAMAEPNVEQGLARLRRVFELLTNGLAGRKASAAAICRQATPKGRRGDGRAPRAPRRTANDRYPLK